MEVIKRYKGFTLIELMITVALAVIVLTMAVPSFQEMIRNNHLTAQANQLVSALNIARSEAIKRGIRITVCKSNNQTTCTSSSNWEKGWIIFTDPDGDGQYDSGEELIQASAELTGKITLRTGGNFSNYVSYLPNGLTKGSGLSNDTFRLCGSDNNTTNARSIKVSNTGRIRTEKGASVCP